MYNLLVPLLPNSKPHWLRLSNLNICSKHTINKGGLGMMLLSKQCYLLLEKCSYYPSLRHKRYVSSLSPVPLWYYLAGSESGQIFVCGTSLPYIRYDCFTSFFLRHILNLSSLSPGCCGTGVWSHCRSLLVVLC